MTEPLPAKSKNTFAYGRRGPKPKAEGLDWDKLKRETNARLDREWDEGVRRNDTIRRRWMKTLSPERLKYEEKMLLEGKYTPLALGEDGEPYATSPEPVLKKKSTGTSSKHKGNYVSGTGKTGRRNGDLFYDIEAIVKMYVEDEMSPQEITDYYHGKPSYPTVINYLKKRGVFDPQRHRSGGRRDRNSYQRQRKDKCSKGHDLTDSDNVIERFRKMPDGSTRPNGRDCKICSRERSRKNPGPGGG